MAPQTLEPQAVGWERVRDEADQVDNTVGYVVNAHLVEVRDLRAATVKDERVRQERGALDASVIRLAMMAAYRAGHQAGQRSFLQGDA